MATRNTTGAAKSPAKTPARAAAAKLPASGSSSPVRNTPIPKTVAAAAPMAAPVIAPRREITQSMIAARAYEIYASGNGGSEADNWFRAERELRGV